MQRSMSISNSSGAFSTCAFVAVGALEQKFYDQLIAGLGLEPSTLQGRRGQANVDETTVRGGLTVTYLPRPGWLISASLDLDRADSVDPVRGLRRTRVSLGATRSF